MSGSILEKYYKWHAPIYDLTRWSFLRGRAELVNCLLKEKQKRMILELGCGTGWLLARGASKDHLSSWHGIDLSASMIKIAQKRLFNKANVQVLHGDFLTYKSDQKYDVIYASYSLSMMSSLYEQLFPKIVDLLQPNGKLYVVDFYETSSDLFKKWMNVNHVSFLNNHEVEFRKYFEVLSLQKTSMYLGLWKYAIMELQSKNHEHSLL